MASKKKKKSNAKKQTAAAPHKPKYTKRVVVFVYGTLKKGFPLHGWLENGKYLGKDTTYGCSLISMGNYPALLFVTTKDGDLDRSYGVTGELWSVPEDDFLSIKAMEERVGYVTLEVTTASGVEANVFAYDSVRKGNVEWASNGSRYGVAEVPFQDDDIPF